MKVNMIRILVALNESDTVSIVWGVLPSLL